MRLLAWRRKDLVVSTWPISYTSVALTRPTWSASTWLYVVIDLNWINGRRKQMTDAASFPQLESSFVARVPLKT
ncbi:hypothetical protein BDP81DRAFT_437785 [Colletotrichum phormii]|uniref:Uncharacterized protein n=1 Tax=Colletotrichum phormii TaxID=359342 RepID=A0AAI9ZHG3_9PEZI|nr:uncharacterized protein BDP81DRAFT_437785 [Colletotrichum phormii]KAK1624551.1 hypothetical protein BDP81DRAFT_437785 [Colletotrichum phormii]